MRWFNTISVTTAFLCQIYVTLVLSLLCWAVFPLFIGWTPTVVISGSMEPRIQTGDIIFADTMPANELRKAIQKGHVLLADNPNKPGTLITHRVIEIRNKGTEFITKGDANSSADSTPVPLSNAQGIEKFRVPYLGIPLHALQKGDILTPGVFTGSVILSMLIVRRQWHIEKIAKEERKLPEENISQNGRKRQFLSIAISLLVGTGIITGSLTMASSAAAWGEQKTNVNNTFLACDVFKRNANQNTSGPECGNNGN
jgi:signal peptidase